MASISSGMVVQASAHLAAAGRYGEALQMLDTLAAEQVTTAVRLLRAKILAQQGRFAEAIVQWRDVLGAEPDNVEAKRGIELAKRMECRTGRHFLLRTNLHSAGLLVVIVGLLLGLSFALGRRSAFTAVEPTLADQKNQIQVDAKALEIAQAMVTNSEDRATTVMRFTENSLKAMAQREANDKAVLQTLERIAEQLATANRNAERRLAALETATGRASVDTASNKTAADQRLQAIECRIALADKNTTTLHTAVEKRFAAFETNVDQVAKAALAANSTASDRLSRASEAIALLQAGSKSLQEAQHETSKQLARIERDAESRNKTLTASVNQVVELLAQQAKRTPGLDAALQAAVDNVARTSSRNTDAVLKELQTLRSDVAPLLRLSAKIRFIGDMLDKMSHISSKRK